MPLDFACTSSRRLPTPTLAKPACATLVSWRDSVRGNKSGCTSRGMHLACGCHRSRWGIRSTSQENCKQRHTGVHEYLLVALRRCTSAMLSENPTVLPYWLIYRTQEFVPGYNTDTVNSCLLGDQATITALSVGPMANSGRTDSTRVLSFAPSRRMRAVILLVSVIPVASLSLKRSLQRYVPRTLDSIVRFYLETMKAEFPGAWTWFNPGDLVVQNRYLVPGPRGATGVVLHSRSNSRRSLV